MAELIQTPQPIVQQPEPAKVEPYKAPEYKFRELNHDNLDGIVNMLMKFRQNEETNEEPTDDSDTLKRFIKLLSMLRK
jgi:hypothetical protein